MTIAVPLQVHPGRTTDRLRVLRPRSNLQAILRHRTTHTCSTEGSKRFAACRGNAGKGLVMKCKSLLLAAALVCGAASSASAAVIVSVDAQSAPWDWQAGGLNDSFQFGVQDNIAPRVVTFATA